MIRTMRRQKGWTLERLSQESGVPRVTINRYELGRRTPNLTNSMKLAKALGCTVEELFGKNKEGESYVD